jgi:hypothetical protein
MMAAVAAVMKRSRRSSQATKGWGKVISPREMHGRGDE